MSADLSAGKRPMTVLVVDDTATNRQILQVFLKRLGMAVLVAEDGAQAVERYTQERPDLVLMDVMMPVMDGYEATRRIKAIAGERWVPVIFLSALDKEENLVAGLDAGGDDYLPKPVNFVILDAKLRSLARTLELQRALDSERNRFEAITANLIDAVIAIDERGIVQWGNPAVAKMFGYPQTELVGQNVRMLMPEPHRSHHDDYLRSYVNGGQPSIIGKSQRLLEGRRQTGEVFPIELGVSEMRVDGERQFVGVLRDVTERVEAERALSENARKLQEYHDYQEQENTLAREVMERQMLRAGLADPAVRYWLAPAANFSGDIVAAHRGPGGDLYVLLADATGHGLGAAVCTLPVLSVFYSLAHSGAALAWVVEEINAQLMATMPLGRFVATTALCISASGRRAEAWVGGTPDLLLVGRVGNVKRTLASAQLPLGIVALDLGTAGLVQVDLEEGDQFVLFSDGLIEAEGENGESFGLDRLGAAMISAAPEQRIEAVKNALQRHLGARTPHDDLSLLIVDCGPVAAGTSPGK